MSSLSLPRSEAKTFKDADYDSVDDSIDQCLNTAQYKMVNKSFRYAVTVREERLGTETKSWPVDNKGCEFDSDHDGVKDSMDYCPDDSPIAISKDVAENGCPKQTDGDGTPDYRDDCPGTERGVMTDARGCPKLSAKKVNEDISKQIQNAFRDN